MNEISSVALVSDGILVGFGDGTKCYFAAEFLQQHIGLGSNQIFINHDPSLQAEFSETLPRTVAVLLPC